MPILAAENCFKKGLVALSQGRPLEATDLFQSAMKIEREGNASKPEMRYLSYFGLSVAKARRPTREAIKACETAASEAFYNPNLLLNLGQVYMMAGKRAKALAAFHKGLRIAPEHRALAAALAEVDRRSRPVFPRLHRDHPLNRWLGRLRAAMGAAPQEKVPHKRTV